MSLLKPDSFFASLEKVDLKALQTLGIKNLLIDLEGTLVPRNDWKKLDSRKLEWIKTARTLGFKICLISNTAFFKASSAIASDLGVPIIIFALKPLPFSFKKAMKILGGKIQDTAIIGDQLFMDILGGNILKLRTILVNPVSSEKNPVRKMMRKVEDQLLKREL